MRLQCKCIYTHNNFFNHACLKQHGKTHLEKKMIMITTVYTIEPPLSGRNGTKGWPAVTWILPETENSNNSKVQRSPRVCMGKGRQNA